MAIGVPASAAMATQISPEHVAGFEVSQVMRQAGYAKSDGPPQ